jgi:MOSC domain-containing protein YiiM
MAPAHPDAQINIMNARVIPLVAQATEHWPLAGDQLYLDLNLSDDNLPPGSKVAIGSAVLEVAAKAHLGCNKFLTRFGADACRFVNSAVGKQLHLRGLNAKVVHPGTVRVGDIARKLAPALASSKKV